MAQPTHPVHPAHNNPDSSAFGITSMVTGILSLVLCWIPLINFSLAVVAVIFGILGIKKPASKGMAIAGLATGGLGLLISLILGLTWLAILIGAAASTSTY